MQSRWQRAKEIFAAVIELDPGERAARLESECGDDRPLRAEVERLLAFDNSDIFRDETRPREYFPEVTPETWMYSPGDLIGGRFEVQQRLGRGGMGEVYEVLDHELGTRVALKTIRAELLDRPGAREDFKEEILQGRRVAHRNICKTYDLAPDQGREQPVLAFTMELLQGETLAMYLQRREPLNPGEAMPLIRQMAAGLQELHHEGITHRDLKPANVILKPGVEGAEVKLTDFGLAQPMSRAAGEPRGAGDSVVIAGTIPYMSLEQLTAQKIGPASDVFALGVVIYEMVTGRLPFSGKQVLDSELQRTAHRPAAPSEHNPAVGKHWDRAILACLAADPAERPRLGTLLTDLQTERRAGAWEEFRIWLERMYHRFPLVVHAGLVAIFVALVALIFRYGQMNAPESPRTAASQHLAILPFSAIGQDPELKILAEGLMATITRRMTQFEVANEQFVVTAPSVVLGRGVTDPQAAAEKLGVNYVVEGDLQGSENKLVLTLTLVDARNGHQLDTEIVTGLRDNLLALQDGAVRQVANALNLRLQPERLALDTTLGPAELGAAQFYTAGIGYLQRSDVMGNLQSAIEQFNRAINLDQQYALAQAGLCDAEWRMYERTSDPRHLTNARASCTLALRLNDQLPEAHIAAGNVHLSTGEYDDAISSFEAALKLDAKNADALLGLASVYSRIERTKEALATFDRAIGLRPADWRVYHQLGGFYVQRGDFEAAIPPLRRVMDLTPRSAQALSNLGMALAETGRLEEAKGYFERSVEIEPRPAAIANLAKVLFDSGDYGDAAKRYEQAVKLKPFDYRLKSALAAAYEHTNDPRFQEVYLAGAQVAREALELNPMRHELYSEIAHDYAGANRVANAERWLKKAVARRDAALPDELFVTSITLARIDRIDEAVDWLLAAIDGGYPKRKARLTIDRSPWLEKLRSRSEVETLIVTQ